jgi:5-methylcytosine-specific restriction endonuclease McrA
MDETNKSMISSDVDAALDRILNIARNNSRREHFIHLGVNSKVKKRSIPSTVKRLVWHQHIGEDVGKAKCMCCKTTDITQLSFHCGHIVAEACGGNMCVDNLRPICQNCNSSMGTMNMNDFMMTYKI